MSYGRAWTYAEDQRLTRLWSSGLPMKTVAVRLERSVDVVRNRLRTLGISYDPSVRNQCAWTPEADARLSAMWADPSITAAQIGNRMGTTGAAIKTRAATIGLPRRGAYAAGARLLRPTVDDEAPDVSSAEKHADACLARGGFAAFSETWAGRGSIPQSVSLSKDWKLGPLEPSMRRAA